MSTIRSTELQEKFRWKLTEHLNAGKWLVIVDPERLWRWSDS